MVRKGLSFQARNRGRRFVPNSGCYALVISLAAAAEITVGALGTVRFAPGRYVYVGRARRNLPQRLARYLEGPRRIRWHIDYLLAVARIELVAVTPSLDECGLAAEIAALAGSRLIPRFGSGDCRCPGHLIAVNELPLAKLGLTEAIIDAEKPGF
jgi:sugar fermentation stimulation protein A